VRCVCVPFAVQLLHSTLEYLNARRCSPPFLQFALVVSRPAPRMWQLTFERATGCVGAETRDRRRMPCMSRPPYALKCVGVETAVLV
jgi:hypothetical protein